MILKRVGVLSVGKMMGCLYAVLGLIEGAIFSLVSVLGATFGSHEGLFPGALFGVLAIIFLPLIAGVIGFIGGIIVGALYNVASGMIGGIELEFEGSKPDAFGGTTRPV
jgi:hypothetical protein